VTSGHVEVIRILLDQGADPTAKANDGRTPFHIASSRGHVEVIRILLEQGADPTAKANDGQTPFHIASSSGHVEVIRILLDQGADPAGQDRGWLDTIPLCVVERTCGSDSDTSRSGRRSGRTRTKDGWTPFHFASDEGTCGSDSDTSRAGRRSGRTGPRMAVHHSTLRRPADMWK
jgi:ankyrin repeat protein